MGYDWFSDISSVLESLQDVFTHAFSNFSPNKINSIVASTMNVKPIAVRGDDQDVYPVLMRG